MARAVLPSPPAARVDAPAMWHVTVPWLASRPQSPAAGKGRLFPKSSRRPQGP